MPTERGIIYDGGIIIEDSQILTMLATFYETVYLPNCTHFIGRVERRSRFRADSPSSKAQTDLEREIRFQTRLRDWESKLKSLFTVGVLRRLDIPEIGAMSEASEDDLRFGGYERELTAASGTDTFSWRLSMFFDMYIHMTRTDTALPRMFTPGNTPDRAALVLIEGSAAFRYFLPALNSLEPDDILELRQITADTREGFTMHLQTLSKDLDGIVKSGGTFEGLSHHAQSIVETDLIPDYREFQRQLAALSAGRLSNVLDAAGKIAEIDAAPWTPKFWSLLLKALGMTFLESTAEKKEKLSNRYQAYEFIRTIEDLGRRQLRP